MQAIVPPVLGTLSDWTRALYHSWRNIVWLGSDIVPKLEEQSNLVTGIVPRITGTLGTCS
jgi:hypothetical protein